MFEETETSQDEFVVYDGILPRWNENHPLCKLVKSRFSKLYADMFSKKDSVQVLANNLNLEEVEEAIQKRINSASECQSNFVPPLLQISAKSNVTDVAMVQCLFGQDEEQISAAMSAVSLIAKSGQVPEEWIFVEAQRNRNLARMEGLCLKLGIEYVFQETTDRSEGVFLKNALWCIGAKKTHSKKLVFVDADVAFSNSMWLENTSKDLDEFEVVQPFQKIWYSCEKNDSGDKRHFKAGFKTGFACALKLNGKATHRTSVTGYALAMTRAFFDRIGQTIDVLPSNGSDVWFWYKHLPASSVVKSQLSLPLSVKDYLHDLETDRVSYSNNIAFHVSHGTRNGSRILRRQWHSKNAF